MVKGIEVFRKLSDADRDYLLQTGATIHDYVIQLTGEKRVLVVYAP